MALEVISLGTLSPLYELLNKDDKKTIAKQILCLFMLCQIHIRYY